jgi:hypothetical protein
VAEVELPEAGATENAATAMPLMDADWGEPGASSVTVNIATVWPVENGLNTRETVQLAAGESEGVQLLVRLNSEALDPARETEEICKGAFPELMTDMVCGALEVPCVVEGKDGEGGEKVRAGRTAMPAPVRATVCGEPEASSAIIKLATRWPAAVGVKTREMTQFEPGASGAMQLLVKLKSEGLGPAKETEEMFRVVLPELMMVSV